MYTGIFALIGAVASVIFMMGFGGSAATGGLMLIIGLIIGLSIDHFLQGQRAAKHAQAGGTPADLNG
jgi:hypothetical protein